MAKGGKTEKRKGTDMEGDRFECWVDIPGTDGRFQVSNLGHLRMIAKKTRIMGRIAVVLTIEPKPLVCDYKTGRLGWWIFYDGSKLFLPRDELMALFPPEYRQVDSSLDEAATAKRNETYCPPESFRKANKKGNDT